MLTESSSTTRAADQTTWTTNKPKSRRDWSPTQNDVRIYELVKFGGKSQEEAANLLGFHQSTVSRILQRMERWQAHVEGRAAGRLDPAERLRAQQWLTYERNELILGRALRLAEELEGSIDTSSSVIHRPLSEPSQEHCIRSTFGRQDRTGLVVRYLRLAFDINMQQLKLCAAPAAELPEPLSEEELAAEQLLAAEAAAEFAAKEARQQEQARKIAAEMDRELAAERAAIERDQAERAEWERQIAEMQASEAALQAERAATASQQTTLLGKPVVAPALAQSAVAAESCSVMHGVHNEPRKGIAGIAATAGRDLSYSDSTTAKGFSGESGMKPPPTKLAASHQAAHASGLR